MVMVPLIIMISSDNFYCFLQFEGGHVPQCPIAGDATDEEPAAEMLINETKNCRNNHDLHSEFRIKNNQNLELIVALHWYFWAYSRNVVSIA
jgi:hypothetical protein